MRVTASSDFPDNIAHGGVAFSPFHAGDQRCAKVCVVRKIARGNIFAFFSFKIDTENSKDLLFSLGGMGAWLRFIAAYDQPIASAHLYRMYVSTFPCHPPLVFFISGIFVKVHPFFILR